MQMIQAIEHDLNQGELAWLVERCPKGKSRWEWVSTESGRMEGPVVRIEHGQIVEASARDCRWTTTQIVRGVYLAHRRIAERRSASAKKAAETRKGRQDARVYALAKWWLKYEKLPPSKKCHMCGKSLDDAESIDRGVGSDCWQNLLTIIEHTRSQQVE